MPSFILINELTRCAKRVSEDQIRSMVDYRTNPHGGYTDVDRCMEMILHPEDGGYKAFPVKDSHGNLYSIHVEGRMDFKSNLRWRPADHQCNAACMIPDEQKRIIQVVSR